MDHNALASFASSGDSSELTPEQEAELSRRIQAVESGRFVNGDEFLNELSRE